MEKGHLHKDQLKKKQENHFPISLLETGQNAFPEIISQIRSARQEILLHMFIWREDRIGTGIAQELLKAADRGVSIVIEKDRYGLLLEYAEESQRSFCHSPNLWERIEIRTLCLLYNRDLFTKPLQSDQSALYRKLKEHPNVIMKDSRKTEDHSKYYIFDSQVMILGGINIEDKEYDIDRKGRAYHDYMVRIGDAEIISQFLEKRESPRKKSDLFRINTNQPVRCFELKESFLELIDEAESQITIMMAYFAPEKEIMSAVFQALDRGVSVRIMIPRSANYHNDTNGYTVSKLLRYQHDKTKGKLSVFMTGYMLHTKLIMNEKRIMTGSCNINRKSFDRLGELCIVTDNDDSLFACQVRASVQELFDNSVQINGSSNISYNHLLAAAELLIMR
ncbi:MAG: phosphatidylserine/phosphatidylglycerophosphate/cardiolipin synthase family protein [Erysipelotrichaceae bacterium]|nr:phosphatidylserine/phosphatidylglycerophosphate/cardiolipin synthase family protein [Erysipelotrichaceae bacterium]